MARCLYCYKELGEEEKDFHKACSKKMFGTHDVPELPYTRENLSDLARQVIRSQTTLTGVQAKLSLDINRGERGGADRFTIVGLWGRFILKPQTDRFDCLPEVEDLTMHLAELAKMKVVPMETLKEVMTEEVLDFDRAMSYPTYCPTGLVLKEEVKSGSGDNQRIILTYSGSSFITIIEKFITPFETLKTEYIDGDLYVLGGVVAVVNNESMKFYESGIEYTLASANIDKLELAWIGDSLRLSNEK